MEAESAETNNFGSSYKLRTRTPRNLNEEALSKMQVDYDSGSVSDSNFQFKTRKSAKKKLKAQAQDVSWSEDDEAKVVKCSSSSDEEFPIPDHVGTHISANPEGSPKTYECSHCDQKFTRSDYLKIHLDMHFGNKFNCLVCDKVFIRRNSLTKHILRNHKSSYPGRNSQACSLTCPKCSLRFQDQKSFERHYCESTNRKTNLSHKQFRTVVIKSGPDPARKPKPFSCEHCDKTFTRKDTLDSHLDSHSGKKFKCSACAKYFIQRKTLKMHILRNHKPSAKQYKCQLCPEIFRKNHALQLHERRKHTGIMPYGCPICPKRFVDPSEVKYHVMFHTGEKPRKCSEPGCDKAYTRSSHLRQHMMLHTGERPYSCRVCNKAFRLSSQCRRHEEEVHKVLKSQDRPSNLAYKNSNKINANMFAGNLTTTTQQTVGRTTASKKFACSFCGKCFPSFLRCKRHESTVHKESNQKLELDDANTEPILESGSNVNDVEATPVAAKTKLETNLGSSPAASEEGLLLVNNIVVDESNIKDESSNVKTETSTYDSDATNHDSDYINDDGEVLGSNCSENSESESETSSARRQQQSDSSLPCPVCSKRFAIKRYLNRHIKLMHHKTEPKISCPSCEQTFFDRTGLRKHMDRAHNPLKPRPVIHKCSECCLQFQDIKSLKNHYCNLNSETPPSLKQFATIVVQEGLEGASTRSRSTKDSTRNDHDFKCQFCSQTYFSKQCLEIHERKHKGILPFGCPICPKRFADSAEVKYHVMFHTGEKPYKCVQPGCTSSYKRTSHLTQHMKRRHPGSVNKAVARLPPRSRPKSRSRKVSTTSESEMEDLTDKAESSVDDEDDHYCDIPEISSHSNTTTTRRSKLQETTRSLTANFNTIPLKNEVNTDITVSVGFCTTVSTDVDREPVQAIENLETKEDAKTESVFSNATNTCSSEEVVSIMYCPYCYIFLQNDQELEEHGRTVHATCTGVKSKEFFYKCPHLYCNESLISIKELKNHQRTVHKLKDA